MLKNTILVLSLMVNCAVAYWFFVPTPSNAEKMTCDEARSEILNKQATLEFSLENSGSLAVVHKFLRASDYNLRNIGIVNEQLSFVYTEKSYRQTCGFHFPGIDGSIVRIRTELTASPTVIGVN